MGHTTLAPANTDLGGRPTAYKRRFDGEAYRLAFLGLTGAELGEFFEVTEQTIYNWMKTHASFRAAIKRGREHADGKVAEAMYRAAIGYECEQYQVVAGKHGPEVVPCIERHSPNVAAGKNWLANRQRDKWSEQPPPAPPPAPLVALKVGITAEEASRVYLQMIKET